MRPIFTALALFSWLPFLLATPPTFAAEPLAKIERRLPPSGIELPAEVRERLERQLKEIQSKLAGVADHSDHADAAVLVKAVDYALRHGEFYNRNEIPRADALLRQAEARIKQLSTGKPQWKRQRGRLVRGYRSTIDGSPQPYVLEIEDGHDFEKPAPLYVWLHGRGDKITDLHFIHRTVARAGRIHPPGAIVAHPFGRQCMGFKSAGEIDVLDVVAQVKSQYKIDPNRVVLMGFSMGGAGAWHIGAHYSDRWVAMSPGAGFAETAQYNKLQPSGYPSWYEQRLWGLYDVPNYVRNLFNLPVVVYSGEKDRQIQAARVMEAAYVKEGEKLPHIIGPGMGHNYHPDSLKEILRRMDQAVAQGLDRGPAKVRLQTRTLRYNRAFWVEALRLKEHWRDSRVDAELKGDTVIVNTRNVKAIALTPKEDMRGVQVRINGQLLPSPVGEDPPKRALLVDLGGWRWVDSLPRGGLAKRPGLQGPIDDAFMSPFLVVAPSGTSKSDVVQRWTEFELAHLKDRWRALYRGELPWKRDDQITKSDIAAHNLILWGDPSSNQLIRKVFGESGESKLPIAWTGSEVKVGDQSFNADKHVPVFIYPNPLNPEKYVVINSGPTFREGHDRTNSLQNPKLPDWAVIDLSRLPDAVSPGRVVAADFFGEEWQLLTHAPRK